MIDILATCIYYGGYCQVQIPERLDEVGKFNKRFPDILKGVTASGETNQKKRHFSATFYVYLPFLDREDTFNFAKEHFNFKLNKKNDIYPKKAEFDPTNNCHYVKIYSFPLFEYLYDHGFRPGTVSFYSKDITLNLNETLANLYGDWKLTLPWFCFTHGDQNSYEAALDELEEKNE